MMSKKWAITMQSNAPLMRICYKFGWSAREDKMTFAECAAVTSINTGKPLENPFYNAFDLETFDEFRFFTGITSLPASTFGGLRSLRTITFPPSIKEVLVDGFRADVCTTLNLNEGLERLVGWRPLAFGGTELILPSTLVSCDDYTFYYCTRLTRLVFKATAPPTIRANSLTFQNGHTLTDILVPAESVEAYKAANIWSNYRDIIKAI